ncbi:MAG: PEGA domain-containing protein [Atribacterota bacterium]
MSKGILFQKKGKIFTCIFIALIVFLWLGISGINFAQSPSPEETEKMKSIQIINPHPVFSLRLWLDKDRGTTYAPGERIKIFFQASRDSFVTLYNYDTEGRVKIIFPNRYSPDNFVRAGEVNSVEGLIDPHTRPGIEYVQGFATTRPIFLSDKEKNLISKEFMPEISKDFKNFTITIKGIVVSLPPTAWTSSNLLSYMVRPTTPPTYYGRIIATSHPQGAKVYLDNVYKGVTPLNLDRVTAGQHQVKLVMTGYQDWSSYVSVSPSRTTTVSADLIPLPVYGSISIYCNQGDARIYLDGSYQKRTSANKSVEIKNVKPGYHELMITKDGYQKWVSTILVTANQTRTVSAYLVPEINYYGSITVYCNVNGAKIFVNGTYKTTTSSSQPKILEEFKEKEYEVTLIKDGYRTWVKDIWVYAGETTSIYVEMIEIEY